MELGNGARREREGVEEGAIGQTNAVRRHDVLVLKTARVIEPVVHRAQTIQHVQHRHTVIIRCVC